MSVYVILNESACRHRQAAVVADSDPSVLKTISHPDCLVAVWNREPLASFIAWVDGLDLNLLPSGKILLRYEYLADALAHLCDLAGTPACPEREMLEGDISALAHFFAEIVSAQYLRVRLDVLPNLPDPQAYLDVSHPRLVCLYRGPDLELVNRRNGQTSEIAIPVCTPFIIDGDATHDMADLLLRSRPTGPKKKPGLIVTLDPVLDAPKANTDKPQIYH